MPKSKQQKQQDLEELTEKLKGVKSVVLTSYRGTTVKNIDVFRRTLQKENVFSKVYKISLLKKALEANGVSNVKLDYKTPVILSLSYEDETTPARLVKNLSKEIKTIDILSGIVDGSIVSREQVIVLAELPSKQDLRGMLVRTINAPVSGFVNVLAGNIRGLINVLNAVAQK